MKTIYVTIGNSDNRLTQGNWSRFILDVRKTLAALSDRIYFVGFSGPDETWQNAMFSSRVKDELVPVIRDFLGQAAADHGQDSIALAVVDAAELVTPQ